MIQRSAPPRFAELLGRSCFSFLEGASHPEELVAASKDLGQCAIAVCDRDGLYGIVRAHSEGKKSEQRVLVGAELTLELDAPTSSKPSSKRDAPRLALIAQDRAGYTNLCALLTAAHADHDKGEAGISLEEIAAASSGLVAIAPLDPAWLDVVAWRMRDGADPFARLRDIFDDRAFVAIFRHLDRGDAARREAAHEVNARYGLPIVASARPLFHVPSRKPLADILHCIRHKTTLDQAGTNIAGNAEAFLRSSAQMLALFPDEPAWIERAAEIADGCRFSLGEICYRFPSEELCEVHADGSRETPNEALRRLVEVGARDRYPDGTPPEVREQLEKEIALIAALDVAPYFLSVQQIVRIARDRRILCQGRGSAANSAVCFVLGVTSVDPARSNLLFERFLSAERAEPPDIDVDFEHERREEVIQEIYARYGRDRAAMVSEVIAYRGKSALREVGKAFGLSLDQVDRLSAIIVHSDAGDLTERRLAEVGLDPDDARIRMAVLMANSLEGFPRHLSIHVGGFVLSAEPLVRVAPVEPARMEGRTVLPWDKDDLDDLGFFKVDVLALGMLTAIRKSLAMIHSPEIQAFDPIAALAAIPPEDPAVYEAVQHADTIGVFQIESRAQMAMLPRLRPKNFYDLVIEVAIVRPGPIQGGMVHPYLRRRTGEEPPTSPHPCLDPILERTLGVPLFQEQVMQIAMVGAGYTPGEADQLRRDMAAWKKTGRLERHRDKLLSGFAVRGISERFGEMLYQQIHGFGEYGFPESHAASFALLVYASSWLKVHHAAAFACALLNSQPMGFYSPSSIVQDAQKHGVLVLPPCVVQSEWDSTLEGEGVRAITQKGPMRLGLRQIKGLGEAAGVAIACARGEAPFADVPDLVRRARLKKNEIDALAEAGALGAIVSERREALWRARAPRGDGLFDGALMEPDEDVGLPPLRPMEQLLLDYGRVGLSLGDHPMRHARERLARRRGGRVLRAEDLARTSHGARVVVAGLVIGRQRPATASGVTFITLEDETGVVNLVVHKRVFSEHHAVARHAKLMIARGKVERDGEVIHVLVSAMERLDLEHAGDLSVRSRDFH
jgi:error-prone DNA polymerase